MKKFYDIRQSDSFFSYIATIFSQKLQGTIRTDSLILFTQNDI